MHQMVIEKVWCTPITVIYFQILQTKHLHTEMFAIILNYKELSKANLHLYKHITSYPVSQNKIQNL